MRKFACLLVATLLIGSGCGGSGGGGGGGDFTLPEKAVADAGTSQTVPVNVLVQLDGSGSFSPTGGLLTYQWTLFTKPAGSASTLNNGAVANPTFIADTVGAYVLRLVVNDGVSDSAISEVTITAVAGNVNIAPVADAGPDQKVVTEATVTLDGSGSHDANGDPITHSWTIISKPAGSFATLFTPTAVQQQFTADVSGSYVFALVVNDGLASSDPSTVTISADRLVSISVSPLDFVTTLGFSVQYSALGTYEIASKKVLTGNVTWTSDNTSVATIEEGTGFAVTVSEGVAIIRASYAGLSPFSTTLRVGAVSLSSLEIVPASVTLKNGNNIQLVLRGNYSDGSVIDLTKLADWSASAGSVSFLFVLNDYENKGFVTTFGIGTTSVHATYQGFNADVVVNVTN